MNSRADVGRKGEDAAATLLRDQGYKILARNYRCRHGEIDIIAFEDGEYVFVEVKTRVTDEKGSGADAVTPAKQRKIVRVAQQYLVERSLDDRPCRFDVVAVTPGDKGTCEVLRGAFTL
jgi:putative endonuclease